MKQGQIVFVDLEPAKGSEMNKVRPCLVVSNDNYNRYLNTVVIVPISSSKKYRLEEKYIKSPFFVDIDVNDIHGTALLQHVRALDANVRVRSKVQAKIPPDSLAKITAVLRNFF